MCAGNYAKAQQIGQTVATSALIEKYNNKRCQQQDDNANVNVSVNVVAAVVVVKVVLTLSVEHRSESE
ncbi:hypothetical protein ACLKA7_014625 [Drosophila subpalustris]